MKEVILKTRDGVNIIAHLFQPDKSNGKLVLINSATGVKQQVYFAIAQYFAENSFTVITYDYRGIGLSKPLDMRNFNSDAVLWGKEDFGIITAYIKENFSDYQKYCLGHSVGALILGMNADSEIFEKFIFVGTQNAYVGNLKWKTRIEAYLGFGLVQPLITRLFGYFPAQWFGLGESLPKGNAFDWRKLILNKKSTNKLLERTESFAESLNHKVFVIRAEDDVWLTEKGVKSLLNDTYPNMKPTYRLIKVSESEKGEIGHINFFRSYNRKLWKIILNEMQ
ncbi:alpha/beta hydrolase family protein [Elizabethkingia anophelis]|uniref:alpha/beta hydrolase family protein n=1 Tax=Elizabethkingia anophelis TaxID=1117645 RepID=UPI00162AA719|nr:alpha/beta fold hydrolase [Elizabethkingia anophelis]MCT4322938.1 alpha/beta hydrolase [Elizabethkingia anophelis]